MCFPYRRSPSALHLREPTTTAWRGTTLGTHIDRDISLLMSLRFVWQLRNNTSQSLVLSVKFGARYGRCLAPPVPQRRFLLKRSMIRIVSIRPYQFAVRFTAFLIHYMRTGACTYECLYTNYKSFMQLCQHQNKIFFIFRYILLSKLPIYLHQSYDFNTHLRFCRFLIVYIYALFLHYYSVFTAFMRFISLNLPFI